MNNANASYFPTLHELWNPELQALMPEDNRILTKAVEMAMDNGEFARVIPTAEMWKTLPARSVYLDQAWSEIKATI